MSPRREPGARTAIERTVLAAAERARAAEAQAAELAVEPSAPSQPAPRIAKSATLVRCPGGLWATCELECDLTSNRVLASKLGLPGPRYAAEDQLRVILLRLMRGRGHV